FAPIAIAGLSRFARAVLASRSPAGEMAAANLGSSPVRNSVAVASLGIAIAMMVAVAILIGSFRTTVVAWANDTLTADLFVEPYGSGDASYAARMPAVVAERLQHVRGVALVDTFRGITIPLAGLLTTLGAADTSSVRGLARLRFLGRVDVAQLVRTLPGSTD